MQTCGFQYTGEGDKARCNDCGLELNDWTNDKHPFIIHSTLRPDCPFILSKNSAKLTTQFPSSSSCSTSNYSCPSPSTDAIKGTSVSNEQENPSKRQKIDLNNVKFSDNILYETDRVQEIRRRTFSHWPHRTCPSQSQMIEAGFFNCNVGDRVICIYCNLICQQWTPNVDDPIEVHKILSPHCIYVKAKLIRRQARPIMIVNEAALGATTEYHSSRSNNHELLYFSEFVPTAACNVAFTEIPKRTASFASWSSENLPSVDDLVRAGFFYTGSKSIVTCFYCNGSLQNWGPNDNPMIEHARWFPHCAYAKQLCGADMYRKIQESKRIQQERAKANESRETIDSIGSTGTNAASNNRRLQIPDESTLSRLVAARLDLPISQRLLDKRVKLSIIKRCWEDQLRLKQDDFISDADLHMACIILQKQIEYIDGKKENIVVPSIKMKKIREDAERQIAANEITPNQQTSLISFVSIPNLQASASSSRTADVEMTTVSQLVTSESTLSSERSVTAPVATMKEDINELKSTPNGEAKNHQINELSPTNPCLLCLKEEKRLACIPCGHLATCASCGQSLRSCPICRREIQAFVRVYI